MPLNPLSTAQSDVARYFHLRAAAPRGPRASLFRRLWLRLSGR